MNTHNTNVKVKASLSRDVVLDNKEILATTPYNSVQAYLNSVLTDDQKNSYIDLVDATINLLHYRKHSEPCTKIRDFVQKYATAGKTLECSNELLTFVTSIRLKDVNKAERAIIEVLLYPISAHPIIDLEVLLFDDSDSLHFFKNIVDDTYVQSKICGLLNVLETKHHDITTVQQTTVDNIRVCAFEHWFTYMYKDKNAFTRII